MNINETMKELAQWQRMQEEDRRPFEEKQKQVENLLQEFCLKNGGCL